LLTWYGTAIVVVMLAGWLAVSIYGSYHLNSGLPNTARNCKSAWLWPKPGSDCSVQLAI
jgi:hypothetical protein